MKILFLIVSVVIMMTAIEAVPAKEKFQKKNSCNNECPLNYAPVCAADPNTNSTPRLFSNKCVLNTHNCEHNAALTEVDMNKCKSAGGIRIS